MKRIYLSILASGYIFLYCPIFVLILYSFNQFNSLSAWKGFSFQWYVKLWHNEALLEAIRISISIASFSATIALILGSCVSSLLTKRKKLSYLIYGPLLLPDILFGLCLLSFFVLLEHYLGINGIRSFYGITIAHITFGISYIVLILLPRLAHFNEALIEAAFDLGASPIKAFLSIKLPYLASSLISGWLLVFILSLDDVVIASFVNGPQSTTLPIAVLSSIRYGLTPEINALSVILISFVGVATTIAYILHKRTRRQFL